MGKLNPGRKATRSAIERIVDPQGWYPVCNVWEATKVSGLVALGLVTARLVQNIEYLQTLSKVYQEEAKSETDDTVGPLKFHALTLETLRNAMVQRLGTRYRAGIMADAGNVDADILRDLDPTDVCGIQQAMDKMVEKLTTLLGEAQTLIDAHEKSRAELAPEPVKLLIEKIGRDGFEYAHGQLECVKKAVESMRGMTNKRWVSSVKSVHKRKTCAPTEGSRKS
jgi:hypothetical protein